MNPDRGHDTEVVRRWNDMFVTQMRIKWPTTPTEEPPVTSAGMLRLRWPSPIGPSMLRLDALLATASVPTLRSGRYPSPREIATAAACADYPDYFCGNVLTDIRTVYDRRIWLEMMRLRPDWIAKCNPAARLHANARN